MSAKITVQKFDKIDSKRWKTLWASHLSTNLKKVHPMYYKGLEKLNIKSEYAPDLDEINFILRRHTQWKIQVVDGLVSEKDFYFLLKNRCFPVSYYLRSKNVDSFTDDPDLFHDLLGHIPMLLNKDYADGLNKIGEIGTYLEKNTHNFEILSRLYWCIFEVGLIKKGRKTELLGGSLISSSDEAKHALESAKLIDISLDAITDFKFDYSQFSKVYFTLNDPSDIMGIIYDFEDRFVFNQMQESV